MIQNLITSILLATFLSSCNPGTKVMSREDYSIIEVGMQAKEIKNKYGTPYQIISKDGDKETYEYIERIMMGAQVVEQRRYYIVIKDGKVIGKYVKFSTPPPYEQMYSEDPYPNY